jgi:hypothetical protein
MLREGVAMLIGLLIAASLVAGKTNNKEDKKVAHGTSDASKELEVAVRDWQNGITSGNKMVQEKAMRAMLPRMDDIKYLFPKHSPKLWPKVEASNQYYLEHLDEAAKEMGRGGPITAIQTINVREDSIRSKGSYQRILSIIPKEVMVFDIIVRRGTRSTGDGAFLKVKDRWIWMPDFNAWPRLLDQLK